jgi:hypothetical protein
MEPDKGSEPEDGAESVTAIVEVPEPALLWLDRFYDEGDAALLEALAAGPRSIGSLASADD